MNVSQWKTDKSCDETVKQRDRSNLNGWLVKNNAMDTDTEAEAEAEGKKVVVALRVLNN